MSHPFQCIATVKPAGTSLEHTGFLLAACGPTLLSIDLQSGTIVSRWHSTDANQTLVAPLHHEAGPPSKKQKTAAGASSSLVLGNIIRLTVSPSNRYLIAAADDKCIRVFSIEDDGSISELSSRCMPKRPCAIQILPDDDTILCGDKFGDVYSLPLFPRTISDPDEDVANPSNAMNGTEVVKAGPASFKPSATNKTVHTQRNLKSLAAQQNQKNLTPKTKEPLKFEHKLLLGHVSMLTDVAYATQEVEGKLRGYIVTSDRDEHIRVSRAPPQSHVIEGYCLGHKEFVSKLCLIPGTDLLVSGGGNDWIGVWDWPTFKLLRKIPLRLAASDGAIAVSGIWVLSTDQGDIIAVVCEKIPTLFTLPVRNIMAGNFVGGESTSRDFEDPILAVASTGSTMYISFDSRDGRKRLQEFDLHKPGCYEFPGLQLDCANTYSGTTTNETGMHDLLYGIENLRKRGHHEDHEETEDG